MSDERPVTIFMPLVNNPGELRAVQAIRQREDLYVVVGPMPPEEEWQYPPGSMVRRKSKMLPNGKQEMVASPV